MVPKALHAWLLPYGPSHLASYSPPLCSLYSRQRFLLFFQQMNATMAFETFAFALSSPLLPHVYMGDSFSSVKSQIKGNHLRGLS